MCLTGFGRQSCHLQTGLSGKARKAAILTILMKRVIFFSVLRENLQASILAELISNICASREESVNHTPNIRPNAYTLRYLSKIFARLTPSKIHLNRI